jgi:hypothetical protein
MNCELLAKITIAIAGTAVIAASVYGLMNWA